MSLCIQRHSRPIVRGLGLEQPPRTSPNICLDTGPQGTLSELAAHKPCNESRATELSQALAMLIGFSWEQCSAQWTVTSACYVHADAIVRAT